MKTIDEAAKEHAGHINTIPNIKIFKHGVEFAQRWISVEIGGDLPKHNEMVDFKLSDGSYANGYSEYFEYGDSLLHIWGKSIGVKHSYDNWELKNGLQVTHWRPIELK